MNGGNLDLDDRSEKCTRKGSQQEYEKCIGSSTCKLQVHLSDDAADDDGNDGNIVLDYSNDINDNDDDSVSDDDTNVSYDCDDNDGNDDDDRDQDNNVHDDNNDFDIFVNSGDCIDDNDTKQCLKFITGYDA